MNIFDAMTRQILWLKLPTTMRKTVSAQYLSWEYHCHELWNWDEIVLFSLTKTSVMFWADIFMRRLNIFVASMSH